MFAHSWISDWNHGNCHFLRGLARALVARGHAVRLYEPAPVPSGGWSLGHLLTEPNATAAIAAFHRTYPELDVGFFHPSGRPLRLAPALAAASPARVVDDLAGELRHADLVFVNEWTDADTVAALLRLRRRCGFLLLWHDAHHRACSQPEAFAPFRLHRFDAVLAFGEALRQLYERRLRVRRAYCFHEAADVSVFAPLPARIDNGAADADDVVWIGNWGDEERTAELDTYLLAPAAALRHLVRVAAFGVRYPVTACERLAAAGIGYRGYLPNLAAPDRYARAQLTVHIPRRPYAGPLGGIPTIRVFEALASGIALVCAPWQDQERLFQPGDDYWIATSADEMAHLWMQLLRHPAQRIELVRHGRATVLGHHTCAHRAQALESICRDLH